MICKLGFSRRAALAAVIAAALFVGAPGALAASPPPAYDHVVLAIFENKARGQIIGASDAPYLNGLAAQGANFSQSFAIRHPSQPNYLDLFSGSDQGLAPWPAGNECPQNFASGNLGHQLIASGRTFVGYAEGLPSPGSLVCNSGFYARRHVPWTNFGNLNQATVNRPFSEFPTDFTRLPTVSWVVPNNCNNMHDGPPNCWVSTGDTWARRHLDAYAQWAKTHNSLLIVTWDEDDNSDHNGTNQIATLFVGARITPGIYPERIDHFTVLRTIEAMYGLPALGQAANRSPITDVFAAAPPPSDCATQYNQGFNAGFNPGYKSGFSTAFGIAYRHNGAWQVGWKRGFEAARRPKHTARESTQAAPPAALTNARAGALPAQAGCDQAFNQGFNAGFNPGYKAGFNRAFNVAFDNGFKAGQAAGRRHK
jgi:hypothetical protein